LETLNERSSYIDLYSTPLQMFYVWRKRYRSIQQHSHIKYQNLALGKLRDWNWRCPIGRKAANSIIFIFSLK